MESSKKEQKELVRVFLELGANINQRDLYDRTALIAACLGDNIDVVRILLDHGADATIVDNNGNTALSIAERKQYKEIIALLQNYLARN